jgi:prepilin-type N-terminal cleavage/methylation domain-containing protein
MKRSKSNAFTLVELLVVITIIGILMGLLIPAVGAAREAGRKSQCSVNIKNLALAAVQHELNKGHLPYYVQSFGYFGTAGASAGDPSDPMNSVPGHVKLGGFGVAILPWLEAQPTYEHWTEDRYPITHGGAGGAEYSPSTAVGGVAAGAGFHPLAAPNLAIFQCASNPNVNGDQGANSYISNNGLSYLVDGGSSGAEVGSFQRMPNSGSGSSGTPRVPFDEIQTKNNGTAFFGYKDVVTPTSYLKGPVKLTLDDLKDGAGFTALYSENVQALPWYLPGLANKAAVENAMGTTVLDVSSAPVSQALLSSAYTAGMVWHMEDPDPTFLTSVPPMGTLNPHRFDSTGAIAHAVANVNKKHRINGRGDSVSEDIFVEQMDLTNFVHLARPSSAHVEGVNMGFADGATRYVTETVDYRVYQAIMTPRGKSSDVPWPEFQLTDEIVQ